MRKHLTPAILIVIAFGGIAFIFWGVHNEDKKAYDALMSQRHEECAKQGWEFVLSTGDKTTLCADPATRQVYLSKNGQ